MMVCCDFIDYWFVCGPSPWAQTAWAMTVTRMRCMSRTCKIISPRMQNDLATAGLLASQYFYFVCTPVFRLQVVLHIFYFCPNGCSISKRWLSTAGEFWCVTFVCSHLLAFAVCCQSPSVAVGCCLLLSFAVNRCLIPRKNILSPTTV